MRHDVGATRLLPRTPSYSQLVSYIEDSGTGRMTVTKVHVEVFDIVKYKSNRIIERVTILSTGGGGGGSWT